MIKGIAIIAIILVFVLAGIRVFAATQPGESR